jgi:hypothetical protein
MMVMQAVMQMLRYVACFATPDIAFLGTLTLRAFQKRPFTIGRVSLFSFLKKTVFLDVRKFSLEPLGTAVKTSGLGLFACSVGNVTWQTSTAKRGASAGARTPSFAHTCKRTAHSRGERCARYGWVSSKRNATNCHTSRQAARPGTLVGACARGTSPISKNPPFPPNLLLGAWRVTPPSSTRCVPWRVALRPLVVQVATEVVSLASVLRLRRLEHLCDAGTDECAESAVAMLSAVVR